MEIVSLPLHTLSMPIPPPSLHPPTPPYHHQDFADGEASVLVSTSVIEVGVDVPAATVCIVEHAELFGLSQLHQLRGRIGRASAPSSGAEGGAPGGGQQQECYCVLTYDDQSPGRDKALKRLMTLKASFSCLLSRDGYLCFFP